MTKIIQRHDTAANWASVNPVLAQGEMGIEDDTRKFKFGDGTTAWANLPYASSEGGGGEGGTSNYNDLTNKPTINTMELKGELALGGALKIERASTDAFYNSSRNASKQLTFSVASGYFVKTSADYNYSYGTGGLTINSDRTITPSSYFMMPYKLGDILVYGKGDSNYSYATILYGYKINNKFKPVLATNYISQSGNQTNPKFTSFLNTYKRFGYTFYKDEQLYTLSSITPNATYTDGTTYPELTTSSYGMSSLVYDESLGLYKMHRRAGTNSFVVYQLDTSINEELQKVDMVMVLYSKVITTPSVYTSFDIKDGSTISGNFLTDMTYPEVMALPSVDVPQVMEHNVLSTGNIPSSYVGLDEKPKINGNELIGNINSTDLNIQRVMTPNGGINIVQNGDWHFFDASYDDTIKNVTFNRYNLCTSSGNDACAFAYALNNTSASASKIGTYVDKEKIIPTCGIITPFYKNVTWKFRWANYSNCNKLVFGNYIDGYFYPKYAICPPFSDVSTPSTHFKKITEIVNNSTTVFSGTKVPLTVSTIATKSYSVATLGYITILYDNNTYTFKYSHSSAYNNYYYHSYKAVVTDDTEGLNSCTHCWYIPNNSDLGYNGYTQLALGDWSSACFNSHMDNTKLNNSLILPDSGSNVFTTSISVKTDNVTTKINESGQLEAIIPKTPIATTTTVGTVKPDGSTITVSEDGTIRSVAPANMITSDNIASNATIQGLSTGKLDIDATLLSATGKTKITGLSFPSNNFTDLTAGETQTIYTAPADGWFVAVVTATAPNCFVILLNENNALRAHGYWATSGGETSAYIPVSKGQNVQLAYGNGNVSLYRFIYAEGSKQ